MRRRSVSSLVSPGPRVPMPPPSRDISTPWPDKPRQQVIQLRQFHLQAAFASARARGENIQDELGAVDDFGVQRLFQVALLGGGEVVVEDDHVGAHWRPPPPRNSSTLPWPIRVAASGRRRATASMRSTTSAPALAASSASSSSDSSTAEMPRRPGWRRTGLPLHAHQNRPFPGGDCERRGLCLRGIGVHRNAGRRAAGHAAALPPANWLP